MEHKQNKLVYVLVFFAVVMAVVIGVSRQLTNTESTTDPGKYDVPGYNMNSGVQTWTGGGEQANGNANLNSYMINVNSDNSTSPSNAVTLGKDWSMSLWVWGGSAAPQFSINNNGTNVIYKSNSTEGTSNLALPNVQGQWQHVTLIFKTNSNTSGSLYVLYNDRDLSTGLPKTPTIANDGNPYKVSGTATGAAYTYGLTDPNNGGSKVVLNSFSSFAETSAQVSLTDKTQGGEITDTNSTAGVLGEDAITFTSSNSKTENVYGNDTLNLTYKLAFTSQDTLKTDLQGVRLKVANMEHVTWASNATVNIYATSDTSKAPISSKTVALSALGSTALPTIALGNVATVSVDGTAEDVEQDTNVPEANYQFYNGGAESYMDSRMRDLGVSVAETATATVTPSFTIKPALITSSAVSVVDEDWHNSDGSKALTTGSTVVMEGDKLKYDYNATYDTRSKVTSWSDVLAKINTPSGLSDVTYKIQYSDAGSTTDEEATAAEINAGKKLSTPLNANNQTVHIIVEGTVKTGATKVGEKTIGATTATLSSTDPKHQEQMTTPSYAVIPTPPVANGNLTVSLSPDNTTSTNPYQLGTNLNFNADGTVKVDRTTSTNGWVTKYNEDDNGFVINGTIDGSTPDNAYVSYLVTINGGRTIEVQLPGGGGNKNAFSFRFIKPGKTNDDPDITASIQNYKKMMPGVVPVTLGSLTEGKNTITVQAISNDGTVVSPMKTVYVQTGTLGIDAGDINFDTKLSKDGREENVVPTNSPSVMITNTALDKWNLNVYLSKQITAVGSNGGYRLAGELYYMKRSADGKQSMYDLSQATGYDQQATDGQSIEMSGTPYTNDANGQYNVASSWATSVNDLKLNDSTDTSAKSGMFLHLYGNAKEGDYEGELTWTLSDTPTN